MREYLKAHNTELIERIEAQKVLSKEDGALLGAAIEEFKKNGAY